MELVKFLAREIDNLSSLRRIGELKVYSVRLNNKKIRSIRSICVRYKIIESDGDSVDKQS